MAFKPIPTDRLSILTDKPNKRKPAILKIGLSSSFDEDIIKSIPKYDKIMVSVLASYGDEVAKKELAVMNAKELVKRKVER